MRPAVAKGETMKKWYLVGNIGGIKMLYYVGEFETEQDARTAAKARYKIKAKSFEMESKDL